MKRPVNIFCAGVFFAGSLLMATMGCGKKADDTPPQFANRTPEEQIKAIQESHDIPQQAKAAEIEKVRKQAGTQ